MVVDSQGQSSASPWWLHNPVWSQLWVQGSNPPRMPKHRDTDHRLSYPRVQWELYAENRVMLAGESRRK